MDVFTKVLPKRIATKKEGIFYKEIQQTTIDDNGKSKVKLIDKVFIVRYRDREKERLVTIGKYSQGIREAYCKQKRDEFIALATNGELPPQIEKQLKKNIITLDDIAKQHYDFKALHNSRNERSRVLYKTHISPHIGMKSLELITTPDIERIQAAKVKEKKSPKYCNDIVNEISVIFNWAIDTEKYHGINPAKRVKRLKVDNARERFLSTDEIRRLFDTVRDDEQLYLFTMLALNTGGRLHAIAQLQKKDIDLEHNLVTMKDEKGGSSYKCFLESTALITLLETRLNKLKASDRVLDYNNDGINKIDQYIQNKLKPILDRLFNQGIKSNDRKNRVVIHTLRHTFASHLAINGTPIFTIQKLMNHKTIEMTMRYAKLAPDSGRDAVKGLYND